MLARTGRALLPLVVLVAFACVAAAAILWLSPPKMREASTVTEIAAETPPLKIDRKVPDFSFLNQEGEPVRRDDLKGKIWIAGFIFTRCHMTCPAVTATMAVLRDRLPENVKLVSFSVDPRHDTPEILREYANAVDADSDRWKFLTGDRDSLYRLVRDGFQFAVEENPDPRTPPGELITHTNRLVVVDGEGVARYSYNALDPAAVSQLERVVERLRSKSQ